MADNVLPYNQRYGIKLKAANELSFFIRLWKDGFFEHLIAKAKLYDLL